MKKIFLTVFVAFCFCSVCVNAKDVVYVSGFEDLPLMEGLSEQEDSSLVFDSLHGRIVQTYAKSDTLKAAEVKKFYDDCLKALGWSKVKETAQKTIYERDDEHLEIDIISEENEVVVKFDLS